jgi:tRNA A-37 threonylcarbamoyl transferase component Bud32
VPEDAVSRRAHGFTFHLARDAEPWLRAEVVDRLDDLEGRPGVTVVKRNAVRTVLRVPLEEAVLFLKRYHVRGPLEWLKYLIVPSRAVAEWRAARAMTAAGLPTARAVLMGEKRAAGILRDGCLATVEIPGAEDYVPYHHRHFRDGGDEELRRDHLARLAALVRRLHDLGFAHGDLHSGNLLVTGPPEESRIHLIDLHSVRVGRRVGLATRLGNLSKLIHSLLTATDGADRVRFLGAYEGDRPVLGDLGVVAPRVLARVAALERRRVKSRTKRCLRRSSSFDLARVGRFRLFLRREIPVFSPLLSVGDHLLSRKKGGREVLKDSRRSALSRQLLAGPEDAARVVVKETKCRGFWDVVKNALRRPRGLASWVNGTGLGVRKLKAARAVALVLDGRWPVVKGSWLLMEDLSGEERLDLYVLRRYAGNLSSAEREEKLRLVTAFARFVKDLHGRGVYHGDLKAVNVYVRSGEGGEPRFKLVDYDRVRFGGRVSRRRRIKNLAQLAASVAVLITKTDRLRFFRAYIPDDDARLFERAYNRGVERECRRKIVVRMEPIE